MIYDPEPTRCVVCDARNPKGAACNGSWCGRESGIRKERIRKDEFDAGNPLHFRLQSRGGAWRYYRRVDGEPKLYPYQEKAMKALKENPRYEILTGVGKPQGLRQVNDTRFWNATERAESEFTGRADVSEFRRRMRRLGHPIEIIRDRVEAIHPELLGEFDRGTRK